VTSRDRSGSGSAGSSRAAGLCALRPCQNRLHDFALGVRVVVHRLPVACRQLAFRRLVQGAIGMVGAQPVSEGEVASDSGEPTEYT
jgi:hypothetical protein